jgi:multicomponent Na+:H+ antiporter subunit D
VVVPLVGAAAIVILRRRVSLRTVRALSLAASVTTAGLAAALLVAAHSTVQVYWFGNWTPRHGVALGVSFAVDSFGAAGALFAAGLVAAAVLAGVGTRKFGPLAHALALVLLAAAAGFCLTGDIFNLFVFFELMSVCTIALCALDTGNLRALHGALHFAVLNTIGAFLVLIGIALLYARTGALNLALIGERLAAHRPDNLVVVALSLLIVGFLVKAAIVPFHFWLVDAAPAAPPAVAMLMVGVLDTLGLYAVARIYWTAFSGAIHPHQAAVAATLIGAGVLTAVVGAAACLLPARPGRRFVFVAISHSGLMLIGVGLLNPAGLGGFALYALADGATKAALFALADGRDPQTGLSWGADQARWALLVLAGLILAGMPPAGTWVAKGLLEEGTSGVGRIALEGLVLVVSALTAGAVFRVAFDERRSHPHSLTSGGTGSPRSWTQPIRLAAAGLLVGAFALGVIPGLATRGVAAARRVQDRATYAAHVLATHAPAVSHHAGVSLGVAPVTLGILSVLGALAVAHRPSPVGASPVIRAGTSAVVTRLRALHGGRIGDSTAWLTFGTAAIGAVLVVALR